MVVFTEPRSSSKWSEMNSLFYMPWWSRREDTPGSRIVVNIKSDTGRDASSNLAQGPTAINMAVI